VGEKIFSLGEDVCWCSIGLRFWWWRQMSQMH